MTHTDPTTGAYPEKKKPKAAAKPKGGTSGGAKAEGEKANRGGTNG